MFFQVLSVSSILSCLYLDQSIASQVKPLKSLIWGPGLSASDIVMPARYFFIQTVDESNSLYNKSPGDIFKIVATGLSDQGKDCRFWLNMLDRKDGSFIVRYKLYQTCHNFVIHITHQGAHVSESPYKIDGPVYPEECYCPVEMISAWLDKYRCQSSYSQIDSDLKPFQNVNFTTILQTAEKTFTENSGSMSVCNYAVKNNQIYRKCYGKYVGFNMFIDAILLSLARKVQLPDMEMLFNLGDWPLVKVSDKNKIPMFSWCGSDDNLDILLPTYDITEASLQCMGRVSLDLLSVQGNVKRTWNDKIEKAFWRGRDSRRERLKLIDIARSHPDLFNASLTNFFFFRDEEEKYGPKEKHVSFFNFFEYKYQINIDGTVAAYRFPYLLAGDSLVFKQNSNYYEHFYKMLEPWKHYIPIKSDLSDLVDRIQWAKENDDIAFNISRSGQHFARNNLMPQDIFCYHAILFENWSKRLISNVEIRENMELVPRPNSLCTCHRVSHKNEDVEEKQFNKRNEL